MEDNCDLRVSLIVLGSLKEWQRCTVLNADMTVESDRFQSIRRLIRGESRDDLLEKLRRIAEQCKEHTDNTQIVGLIPDAIAGIDKMKTTTYNDDARMRAELTVIIADLQAIVDTE